MSDEMKTNAEKMDQLSKMIQDISIAMLTTADPDGTLRSRPMAYQHPTEGFDGVLRFFTSAASGKIDEIERDHQVNVAFSNPKSQDYVSISGTATLSRDHAKITELWNPIYKAWFPAGLADPNLALLVVPIARAEYWSAPNSTVVQVLGFVKAALTGNPASGGEHEVIDII